MEGYLGEVRLFASNFAPRNWEYCNGQTIAINSNTALFSLIGTKYGGNGVSTFMLPNTQSRVVLGAGQGPGLSRYSLGEVGGVEHVKLTENQIPAHSHALVNNLTTHARPKVFNDEATTDEPENNYHAQHAGGIAIYSTTADSNMAPTTVSVTGTLTALDTGGNQPHNNIQPVETLHYIICVAGIYPSRN